MSINVTNLTKTFGKQNAVDDISFTVDTGEIVGFLGKNGAGKSTTMKVATTYFKPTKGTVTVHGYDVVKSPMEVRKSIGYLPEHNPLYDDMYVKEYLSFVGRLHKMRGKQLKEKVQSMIDMCGLTKERNKKIAALSKGYRQRVGLAQALIHDPTVLILDEPTTGLDPSQIVEVRSLIKEIGKNKTIIFSTHIMQEVQAICDRAIIINEGKLVANSHVSELQTKETNEKVIFVEFEQAIQENILQEIAGVVRVTPVENFRYEIRSEADKDVRGEIFRLASEKNWTLLGLRQEEKSLEDIFRSLTK